MNINFFPITFDHIVFLPDEQSLESLCKTPFKGALKGCPNFGKVWSCPPYITTLSETKEKLSKLEYFWLIISEMDVTNKILNFKNKKRDKFDENRKIEDSINNFIKEIRKKYPDTITYSCSHCKFCLSKGYNSCSCPDNPCRFPDELVTSPEAVGIDVFKTAENIEIKLEENIQSKVIRIGMIASRKLIEFQEEINK